jgi:amino acid adenylation domain-containing protein
MIGRVEAMTSRYRHLAPANAFEAFRAEAVEQSLPARFAAQVRRFGDRVAVRTRAEAITYADLDRLANGVAHAVLDARGPGTEPVALLFDKGIAQVAAFLGVLKAGKIATPLDPMTPPVRLRGMLERGMIQFVVVDAERLADARAAIGAHGIVLRAGRASTGSSDRDPALALAPDGPALILHTSGSTGHPKGVLHTHHSALQQVRRLTNRYHLGVEDRLTWLAALSTSQGVSNLLLALLNGATLYPWDIRQDGLNHLAQWMLGERITFYRSSTSVFRYFVDHLTGTDNLPSLRLLSLASDPAYAEDVERFRLRFAPTCLLANVLSSTETWTMAMHLMDGDSPLPDGPVPVGVAAEGVEILLLDGAGAPAPEGEPGEIAVRSDSLAVGYWRDPEHTWAAFKPDATGRDVRIYRTGDLGRFLPDGSLVLLGRRDFQVKVRGYRVELEEVERALRGHAGIRAAAVVARADARNETALVGYVVAEEPPGPSVTALSLFLRDRLPSYMIPAVIVAVEALPVTAAGKVDRRALPDPGPLLSSQAPIPPRTPIEARVAAIWADVLGGESVGVEDDFLILGGNSLLATMVIARIVEEFGLGLSMAALLQVPTVAEMAVLIVADLMARLPEGGADELSALRDV